MSDGWSQMPREQPRVCFVCGQPIVITREGCGFKTLPPLASWHLECVTIVLPREGQ